MLRLFIALMIPEPQRSQLALLQGGLPGARWVPPEKFHMTLRFIGEVSETTAQDIAIVLEKIRFPDVQVHLDGIGVFDPGNRPRSLWVGVRDAVALQSLHEKINQALRPIAVMEERRKYLPHVSLARLVDPPTEKLMDYLSGHGGFLAPPFWAGSFALIQSHLTRHGAAYEILEEFSLLPA